MLLDKIFLFSFTHLVLFSFSHLFFYFLWYLVLLDHSRFKYIVRILSIFSSSDNYAYNACYM